MFYIIASISMPKVQIVEQVFPIFAYNFESNLCLIPIFALSNLLFTTTDAP